MKRPVERPGVFRCKVNAKRWHFDLAKPPLCCRPQTGRFQDEKSAGSCPPALSFDQVSKESFGSALWAVVEANLVDQFRRGLAVPGNFLDRQWIRLDLAKALDRVGHLRAR